MSRSLYIEKNMIEKPLEIVAQYLKKNDYSSAFENYLAIYNSSPDFFYDTKNRTDYYFKQHISNAANLARKAGYDGFMPARQASKRICDAIDSFVGIKPKNFRYSIQRSNFFYVPDLETKPFYDLSEIAGVEEIFTELEKNRSKLISLLSGSGQKQNYVELMGEIPEKSDWNKLKSNNWLSIHLLRAGASCIEDDKGISDILKVFSHSCIANCPRHAPEVFISELTAGTSIPPHFGLSNVKLTAHFPIETNTESSITVADDTKYWTSGRRGIIFDDSLQHSAKNLGDEARSVLIFDLCNPRLIEPERQSIQLFMAEHQTWYDKFGKLAEIDRNL